MRIFLDMIYSECSTSVHVGVTGEQPAAMQHGNGARGASPRRALLAAAALPALLRALPALPALPALLPALPPAAPHVRPQLVLHRLLLLLALALLCP